MTFAELATPVIPRTFNILDDEILRGVDPGTVMSLNGPRATELIRILVPETKWVACYLVLCSTGAAGCCGLQC
jgi:poly(A) polymerase Pap1